MQNIEVPSVLVQRCQDWFPVCLQCRALDDFWLTAGCSTGLLKWMICSSVGKSFFKF